MTATREEIINTCEDMDRFIQAGRCGAGVIAVHQRTYDEGGNNILGFEGLRERGWYVSQIIPKEGGDIEILMPWGNPHSEGGNGE